MNKDDFVFETDNVGNLMAGGYKINSKLFNNQMAMKTVNYKTGASIGASTGASSGASSGGGITNNIDENTNFSSLFSNLAVPAGLLVLTNNTFNTQMSSTYAGTVDDNLYNKLLSLTSDKTVNNILNRKFTKKHRGKLKRKKTMKNT